MRKKKLVVVSIRRDFGRWRKCGRFSEVRSMYLRVEVLLRKRIGSLSALCGRYLTFQVTRVRSEGLKLLYMTSRS